MQTRPAGAGLGYTMSENTGDTLNKLRTGERAVVTHVSSSNHQLRNKLLSMGIVEGTIVEVSRIAPLGDPIKIRLLGGKLSLRLSEARSVGIVKEQ